MPKLEINSDNDVLCYIPSGKLLGDGSQAIRYMQDGGTCWFYAAKHLAQNNGFKLDGDSVKKRYNCIQSFRKKQSEIDGVLDITSKLILEDISHDDTKTIQAEISNYLSKSKSYVFINGALCPLSPFMQKNANAKPISRQLNATKNLPLVQQFMREYRDSTKSGLEASSSNNEKSISDALKNLTSYYDVMLNAACTVAESLNNMDGSVFYRTEWSNKPRMLIPKLSYDFKPNTIVNGVVYANFKDRPLPSGSSEDHLLTLKKIHFLDFCHMICMEANSIFDLTLDSFDSAKNLFRLIKERGALLLSGFYGNAYYHKSAHRIVNDDGSEKKVGSRTLMGWYPSDIKMVNRNVLGVKAHLITVIGMQYNKKNPSRSLVLFLDTNDASLPLEKRKAYAMSYNRLFLNRISSNHLIQYLYYTKTSPSPEIVKPPESQQDFPLSERDLKEGFFVSSFAAMKDLKKRASEKRLSGVFHAPKRPRI